MKLFRTKNDDERSEAGAALLDIKFDTMVLINIFSVAESFKRLKSFFGEETILLILCDFLFLSTFGLNFGVVRSDTNALWSMMIFDRK